MTITRLSDRIGPLFDEAFTRNASRLPPGEDWSWEINLSPHAREGAVLYIGVMAPGVNDQQALSTGLVVPGPGALSRDAIESLAVALINQMLDMKQRISQGEEMIAESNGIIGDD